MTNAPGNDSTFSALISALVPEATDDDRDQIANVLSELPRGVLETLTRAGCSVRPLKDGELYIDASPGLRELGIDVDRWPAPPAGLFVVGDRTVYVRSRSRMTIAHETMHALDCALGGGTYLSGKDAELRRAYADARAFITPYAATGIDEWFAESARAYIGNFNDPDSRWPKATRARLRRIDPTTHELMKQIFAGCRKAGPTPRRKRPAA